MLKVYHQFFLYDKNNKLIKKTRKRKSRSFLKQFLQIFYGFCYAVNTIKDIVGSNRTIGGYTGYLGGAFHFNSYNTGGSICYSLSPYSHFQITSCNGGIIVGISNQAVAITDNALITPILHGTTTGTLEYLGSSVKSLTINAGTNTATFNVERLFRNSSGNNIDIQEVGLYSTAEGESNYQYVWMFCILRDIVSPAFTVANGEYLKATYTFSITA